MAISDVIVKKQGREFLEWVYLGIRTGARTACQNYRFLVSVGKLVDAEAEIRRAVDLPHRVRARVNYFISLYGQPALVAAVNKANIDVTLAQLDADLTTLENYATGLVNHRNVDGWSWDQIATDIETQVQQESVKWVFPLPPGYTDVWGQ